MRKHLLTIVAVAVAIMIAAPAFAQVEFKYGGQFRWRIDSQNNIHDGTDDRFTFAGPNGTLPLDGTAGQSSRFNGDDNRNFIDQRLRLYFTFQASKNLKVVTRFEVGDAIWGDSGGGATGSNIGPNRGANLGGDAVSIEVKNWYVEFAIPNTPSTAIIGVQGLALNDSWIIDDDFPAAVLVTKLPPFGVTVGYIAGQNAWEKKFGSGRDISFAVPGGTPILVNQNASLATTDRQFNVDDVFLSLDYAQAPFKASLIGFFQNAHDSTVSIDPRTLASPVRDFVGGPDLVGSAINGDSPFPFFNGNLQPNDNMLFDLGINVSYKIDWLSAYFNFVKNFGSAELVGNPFGTSTSTRRVGGANVVTPIVSGRKVTEVDYEGFMIDAGLTYYCGPWTANIGGFYTTGPEISSNASQFSDGVDAAGNPVPFRNLQSRDIEWFTYPLATGKYFSEIVGGGVLGDDLWTYRGWPGNVGGSAIGGAGNSTVFWRGYAHPTNLWTITAGGSWQAAPKTKLSASYWYFGTSEDVPVAFRPLTNDFKMDNSIGHELNFYVDQGIVDGLTLTLVGAYLFANDAFAPIPTTGFRNLPLSGGQTATLADDAYEIGARLQWNF